MVMTVEIQILSWDRQKNVAGLNWLMGFCVYKYKNILKSLILEGKGFSIDLHFLKS
jgi:hypothetical protein